MARLYTKGQVVFNIFNYIILITTACICLAPFVNMFAISFSASAPVSAGMVGFWPIGFTTQSYEFAMKEGKFVTALIVSIKRVLLGVSINLVFMVFAAYPLSKSKDKFSFRNFYMVFFVITMLISGGMIPTYIVIVKLGLINTLWSLVLPAAIPVSTMVVLMNFLRQMPPDIEEAAMIDGAGIFRRLWSVMLPLMKPALATVGLMCTVMHWNDWFWGIIYMNEPSKFPLQSYLHKMLSTIEQMMRLANIDYTRLLAMMNARTGRASQLFLATVPMMIVYPFLQKYFTKGLVIGSVKG